MHSVFLPSTTTSPSSPPTSTPPAPWSHPMPSQKQQQHSYSSFFHRKAKVGGTSNIVSTGGDNSHHSNSLSNNSDHRRRRRPQQELLDHRDLESSSSCTEPTSHKMHPTYTNQPSLDMELAADEKRSGASSSSSTERMALVKEQHGGDGQSQQDDNGKDVEASLSDSSNGGGGRRQPYHKMVGFKETAAVLMYSFCSISMILVNKSLASSYNHLIERPHGSGKADLNTLLVVFQAAAAVVFLWGCKIFQVLDYPELKWSVVKAWAPVNIFFCLMLFTGMAALQTNSVPMVTIFKNVSNITTATADYFLFGNSLEPLSVAAFAVMLFGAMAAAGNGVETSLIGLFWMLFNCITTTGYVCYMRYATQSIQMTKFGMVYVNNVLCVAFLLPVAFVQGEITTFLRSTALHTWDYGFKNCFAGFVGFFLNAASLHCVSVTGPTTYAIVGSLNKVPVTFLGYFLFHESLSRQTWMFVCVSLLGGFLYTYAKIRPTKSSSDNNKKQTKDYNPEATSRK
ncbi:hypothetical protein ACA910_006467 [Epithemia clementina (nom. ined.)]